MNNGHVFPKVQNIVSVLLPTVHVYHWTTHCTEHQIFIICLVFSEQLYDQLGIYLKFYVPRDWSKYFTTGYFLSASTHIRHP